ncbi:hypothetical protein [Treponema putidum]|uniref:Uncharacterized protein n=1 Tax=Treponema putidum TaxID=221027 RepID=A0ABY5HU10_9SPIR|nr:hypothetical protein [Treponema putidum]UTY27661.1 hypothetical protein E4N76_00670 [Treponema putidum]
MIDTYYLNGRLHWRIYCSTCERFLGDTAPLEQHIDRQVEASGICPYCKGKIHDKKKDALKSPRKTAK